MGNDDMTAAFSPNEYQAVVDRVRSGVTGLSDRIERLRPTAESALEHFLIPDFVADSVLWFVDRLLDIVKTARDKILDLLAGVAAPVTFFWDALRWGDAHGQASTVAGDLAPERLTASRYWAGKAADAYAATTGRHRAAATQIGAI